MRRRYACFVVVASWMLGACAFGLTGGIANTLAGGHSPAATTSMSFTTHAFRHGRPVFGFRLSTAYDHGFAIRSGMLHCGYDARLIPGWLVIVPALELGAGRPAVESIGGVGSYAGAATSLRLRVFGVNDAEPAYNVYAIIGEVVLGGRFGGWMPPETAPDQKNVRWEWAIEAGLRVAVGSDVITSAQGEIVDTGAVEDEDTP